MLTRRSMLKGALGSLSAAVGAVTVGKGADAREPAPMMVQGRRVGAMTFAAQPVCTVTRVTVANNGTGYTSVPVVSRDLDDLQVSAAAYNPDTMVTLERPWRIVNDSSYVNFGKYGDAAGSVFPEYDDRFRIVRHATSDGWYVYSVRDTTMGRGAVYPDPSLTYADASISSQELASRALYVEHAAMLR